MIDSHELTPKKETVDRLLNRAKAGIARARPDAERELRTYLEQFKPDADSVETLPGLKKFATALFEAGAADCICDKAFADRDMAERFLREDLIGEVIEQMSPARGLAKAKGDYKRPANFKVEYQMDESPLAVDQDGTPLDADAQRYASVLFAPHGDIETFFRAADLNFKLFPDELGHLLSAIRVHLEQWVFRWAERLTDVPPSEFDPAPIENKPRSIRDSSPIPQAVQTEQHPNVISSDKGNLAILRGIDGQLKRAVPVEIAGRFGGVKRRTIERAAKKGKLMTEGERLNRKVLVSSLLEYFPPEK